MRLLRFVSCSALVLAGGLLFGCNESETGKPMKGQKATSSDPGQDRDVTTKGGRKPIPGTPEVPQAPPAK
jgi:hypothetical protein